MDIILLEDVEKVGDKHTIVTVKDGYARNYLIPQKLALIANDTNRRRLEDLRRREEAAENKKLSVYQEMATKVEGQVLKIGAKAGTSGKIFGSVTNVQLSAALKDQLDLDVERRKIILPEDVKTLGTYTATLNLHKEVQPTIDFEVVSE
jgi:large subunit ribosomal protein L9